MWKRNKLAPLATITTGILCFAALAPSAAGASEKVDGATIVKRMLDQDPLGYGGAEARLLMVLANNRGQQRKRNLTMLSRTNGDVRRSYVRFSSPADIAGTAFVGVDDDGNRVQHLYLPALAKTRRISGSQRNSSFVGTDYSYADLDSRDIRESEKSRLADEMVGDSDCYVVEVTPRASDSAYGKIGLWIHKTSWLPLRMRFYGKDGKESKRLTVQEIKKVDDRWVIYQSKMVDLKREHSTVMKVIDITLRDNVPLDQFTVRALERG